MQIKRLIPKKRKEIYKMSENKIPYKIYLEESGDAEGVVQCQGRYGE